MGLQRKLQYGIGMVMVLSLIVACQKGRITVPALLTSRDTTSRQTPADTSKNDSAAVMGPLVQSPEYISIDSNIGGFYQAVPANYNSTFQSYPLLIFCIGDGEIGNGDSTQLPLVLRNGPPKLINNHTFPGSFTVNGNTYSFIVISPQFAAWPQPSDIEATIDYAIAHYRVDTTRIYLTGLSMGGGVTWEYPAASLQNAMRLAATLPIAGASYPEPEKAAPIAQADLPVLALQNQNDPTVPSFYSEDYVNYINAYVPSPMPSAILTLFPVSGYDAWDEAYNPGFQLNNLNVYQWMLQYSRLAN